MIKYFEKTGSLEAKPRSERPSAYKSVAVTVSQNIEAIETLSTYGEDRQAQSEKTFMQDGGPPHISRGAKQLLKYKFGLVYYEFIKEWVTINKQEYKETLVRLPDAIRRKRNQLFKSKEWNLLHDNALAHRAIIVQDYLAKHSVSVLPHPPYSPDIAPCDLFFFPKLKMTIKRRRFSSSSEVIENATVELNKLRKIDFELAFQQIFYAGKKCVDNQGSYFEKCDV
ncbi:hypothetical protein LAZ67_16001815 [Cordylochernes scorpioides]|uniref:Transposase n=1 Tax=Cordylochernes scorpioides TaxID=51811 RepID=A0ABY6LF24_9ARAC|nr:hypothetical protein LAZ67_16001815 [Cordylochernes scorpioides]